MATAEAKGATDHLNPSQWLRHLPVLADKRGIMPRYLIYFVTSACPCHCGHCLLGAGTFKRTNDLTLEEIEKITHSFGPMLAMFLTGGEPFLRDDLPEIAELFHRNCKVQKIQIPSSGVLGKKNAILMRRMLRLCPGAHIGVTISIDALGEKHDRIRGIKGLFNRAVATFKELQSLEEEFSNYNTNVTVTVSKDNQDDLEELYDYLRNELHAPNIFNTLVRGRPRCPDALDVDIDKFEAFSAAIDRDLAGAGIPGYRNFPFSGFLNAKNLISRKMVAKIAREKRYMIPCYAGQLAGVLQAEGQLFPCELLDEPLGNLRDFDYDVRRIWQSARADSVRGKIKNEKCFCTHENFITSNILFNPRMLPSVTAKWMEIEWRNRAARRSPAA